MRTLPKFLLAILLLTVASASWAAECPEGYKNNYKGDCVVAPVETITLSDGTVYKGQTRNGQFNGQGTYTFSDEGRYVGAFDNGQPTGEGTYTFADGSVQEGVLSPIMDRMDRLYRTGGCFGTGIEIGIPKYGYEHRL